MPNRRKKTVDIRELILRIRGGVRVIAPCNGPQAYIARP